MSTKLTTILTHRRRRWISAYSWLFNSQAVPSTAATSPESRRMESTGESCPSIPTDISAAANKSHTTTGAQGNPVSAASPAEYTPVVVHRRKNSVNKQKKAAGGGSHGDHCQPPLVERCAVPCNETRFDGFVDRIHVDPPEDNSAESLLWLKARPNTVVDSKTATPHEIARKDSVKKHANKRRSLMASLASILSNRLSMVNSTPSRNIGGQAFSADDVAVVNKTEALRIFIATWNVNGQIPAAAALSDLLKGARSSHILAIGTQETVLATTRNVLFPPSLEDWEKRLHAELSPDFERVRFEKLSGMFLAVFIRADLYRDVTGVESGHLATGIAGIIGNKGGVSIAFQLYGLSFCFINSHFAAHQRYVQDRNDTFARIDKELKLQTLTRSMTTSSYRSSTSTVSVNALPALPSTFAPAAASPSQASLTANMDYVFWFGDLNYRAQLPRPLADRMLAHHRHRAMFCATDQLQREMRRGCVFPGWREAEVHFRPTFKFDMLRRSMDNTRKAASTSIHESSHKQQRGSTERGRTQHRDNEHYAGASSARIQISSTRALSARHYLAHKPHHNVYDSSKKSRVPSWTDRILYRNSPRRAKVVPLKYDALMHLVGSDHRPVVGVYRLPGVEVGMP